MNEIKGLVFIAVLILLLLLFANAMFNRHFRKNLKSGDSCYYVSKDKTKVHCKIIFVKNKKARVTIRTKDGYVGSVTKKLKELKSYEKEWSWLRLDLQKQSKNQS